MSLDIYLQKENKLLETSDNLFLSLEDDGYHWFLYEFFEDLAKQSGQMIDLYDDAFFKGESLDLLNQTIQQAKEAISQKPEVWDEFIGTTLKKGGRTKVERIYSTVCKKNLEVILITLEKAITKAKEKNLGILFIGD